MALPELFDRLRTGVLHINFVRSGNRIASGSAFVVGDYVVTNNHVFRGPEDCEVVIRFSDSDPLRFDDGIVLPYRDFAARLVTGSDERNFDFAVLRVPEVRPRVAHRFSFAPANSARIGMSIAFLGYPLEHLNLVCHAGVISSIYRSGTTKVLQLDASVNHSNSGGPLVDVQSGDVIGIITRKATGLTQMFQELLQSFEQNIRAFEGARGMVGLAGIDPMAALAISQRQLQHVAHEIERSANVGIGYAFASDHVASESVFQ